MRTKRDALFFYSFIVIVMVYLGMAVADMLSTAIH